MSLLSSMTTQSSCSCFSVLCFLSFPELTTGTTTHGLFKPPLLPVGPDTPRPGDRPLHSAAARHLVALRHPVSRSHRRNHLSGSRGASRYRTRTPLVQRVLPPQPHRTTSGRGSR